MALPVEPTYDIPMKSKWQYVNDKQYQGGFDIEWQYENTTQRIINIKCRFCNTIYKYNAKNLCRDVTNHRVGTSGKKGCPNPDGEINNYIYIHTVASDKKEDEVIVVSKKKQKKSDPASAASASTSPTTKVKNSKKRTADVTQTSDVSSNDANISSSSSSSIETKRAKVTTSEEELPELLQ